MVASLLLVGCSQKLPPAASTAAVAPTVPTAPPSLPRVSAIATSFKDDVLSSQGWTFDIGTRPFKAIRAGGSSFTGSHTLFPAEEVRLKATFQRMAATKVRLRLELTERSKDASGTSSIETDLDVKDGLKGLRPNEEVAPSAPPQSPTELIRWTDAKSGQPQALMIER